ncbi:hypothetical protein GCM10020256_19450 [Streptomyces thermocoprophilus]
MEWYRPSSPHDGAGVVVLDVQQGEVVAQGVDDRQIGAAARVLAAPLAGAVVLVAHLHEEGLRGHGEDERVAVAGLESLHRGDQVDDHRGLRVAEVGVVGVQGQRVALEVDVESVQAVLVDDP